jgi:hypothetical protein
MLLNWLSGFFGSIFHEFQSRKFRAMMIVVMGIMTGYLQGVTDSNQTLMALVGTVMAYILGVAGEDAAAKLAAGRQ